MRPVVLVMLAFAAVVAGGLFLTVQPMYASSGSMSPAIDEGDAYFVVKGATVTEGDIITFTSSQTDGYVTHRVVRDTANGYYTQGDANPSTDQAAGHPPVSDSAVVGTVFAVNGHPITIPGVAPIAIFLQQYRFLLLGIGGLLVLGMTARSFGNSHVPERQVLYVNDIMIPLFIGGLLVSLLLIFWGASVHDLTYVATQGDPTRADTIPVGESVTRTVTVDAHTMPLTTLVVDANGVTILEQTKTAAGLELLVEVPPKDTPGPYRTSVAVSTYPATLPHSLIETLHGIHWLVAALTTSLVVYGPVYLLYLLLVDGRTPLRLPPSRWLRRVGGG